MGSHKSNAFPPQPLFNAILAFRFHFGLASLQAESINSWLAADGAGEMGEYPTCKGSRLHPSSSTLEWESSDP
ncbi:hypothetical protein V6N12_052259 [Hibiscus sabdariffa]|uniref:Uncharacterized protein n=1 Tax=Hibiscus sabdariffa TaxID=183260 RepID=A0ABR2GHQ7_9ROSI